jgi:hypothetical protein
VPLAELTVRYWYTIDLVSGDGQQTAWCDWAVVGCANVIRSFVTLPATRPGADRYLQVSFSASAGGVTPGGTTGDIQLRFNKNNWENYQENGDWSFDPTKTAFADWGRVTLYHNGTLVWGVEP